MPSNHFILPACAKFLPLLLLTGCLPPFLDKEKDPIACVEASSSYPYAYDLYCLFGFGEVIHLKNCSYNADHIRFFLIRESDNDTLIASDTVPPWVQFREVADFTIRLEAYSTHEKYISDIGKQLNIGELSESFSIDSRWQESHIQVYKSPLEDSVLISDVPSSRILMIDVDSSSTEPADVLIDQFFPETALCVSGADTYLLYFCAPIYHLIDLTLRKDSADRVTLYHFERISVR